MQIVSMASELQFARPMATTSNKLFHVLVVLGASVTGVAVGGCSAGVSLVNPQALKDAAADGKGQDATYPDIMSAPYDAAYPMIGIYMGDAANPNMGMDAGADDSGDASHDALDAYPGIRPAGDF